MEGERVTRGTRRENDNKVQTWSSNILTMSLGPHLFCRFQSRMGGAWGRGVNALSEYSRYPVCPKGGVSSRAGLDGRPGLDDLRRVGVVSLPLTTQAN